MVASISSIVPNENLIGPLRVTPDPTKPYASGFRGVYFIGLNQLGTPMYAARFKFGGSFLGQSHHGRGGGRRVPGSVSPLPTVSAMRLALRYLEVFGPDWVKVLESRKCAAWRVRYSPNFKGYLAAVWVRGRREEVVALAPLSPVAKNDSRICAMYRRTNRLRVFETHDGAKQGIETYMVALYGPEWRTLLWRTGR